MSKKPTAVRYEMPPGVHSNVTPPSIRVQGKTLYFLPDGLLVQQGSRYGSVSYQELGVATRPSRFIVETAPPAMPKSWATRGSIREKTVDRTGAFSTTGNCLSAFLRNWAC